MDNHPLFPDVCAKSGKWFRRPGVLFRGRAPTKQLCEKLNDFNQMRRRRPCRPLGQPSRSLADRRQPLGSPRVKNRRPAADESARARRQRPVQNPLRLFNLSLVKKPTRQRGEDEPMLLTDRPIQRATFPGDCAL
jgi:hypothetical protein